MSDSSMSNQQRQHQPLIGFSIGVLIPGDLNNPPKTIEGSSKSRFHENHKSTPSNANSVKMLNHFGGLWVNFSDVGSAF